MARRRTSAPRRAAWLIGLAGAAAAAWVVLAPPPAPPDRAAPRVSLRVVPAPGPVTAAVPAPAPAATAIPPPPEVAGVDLLAPEPTISEPPLPPDAGAPPEAAVAADGSASEPPERALGGGAEPSYPAPDSARAEGRAEVPPPSSPAHGGSGKGEEGEAARSEPAPAPDAPAADIEAAMAGPEAAPAPPAPSAVAIPEPPAAAGPPAVFIAPPPPAAPATPTWLAYARPFDAPAERPRIAVVVVGLGDGPAATAAAIELPGPVTLAFHSHARDLQDWIDRARAAGHEVLLDVPMEPADYPAVDPGPHPLLTSLSSAENLERLAWHLGRATGYAGVTHSMGGRFTASAEDLRPVLSALKARGLMFLDGRTSAASVAAEVAAAIGLPRAVNDRHLDDRAARGTIDRNLGEIERLARARGHAVAVGRPFPVTLERVGDWLAALDPGELAAAPVSAVARRRSTP